MHISFCSFTFYCKKKKGNFFVAQQKKLKPYRNWREILELRKFNPELALALAVCDTKTKQGIVLLKSFPSYFCTQRCLKKKIPFSWLFYVARKNAHTKIEDLTGEDIPVDSDIVKHLFSHGALEHFDIPFIMLGGMQNESSLPQLFMGMKLRPFTVIMYKDKKYYIVEELEEEVVIVEIKHFENDIPDILTDKTQLSPL